MNPPEPSCGVIPTIPAGAQAVRVDALAVEDAAGVSFSPGSLLLRVAGDRLHVLAVGTPAAVDAHEAAPSARRISRPEAVVIPGLVNAHTHLDLTHIGPRTHDPEGGFMPWAQIIRTERRIDEAGIAASVRRGVELARAGGTVAVGDIAGAAAGRPSLAAWRALRESPLLGVGFLEFFALGTREAISLARLEEALSEAGAECSRSGPAGVRLGLQPHAPYSVGPAGYRAAIDAAGRLGMRVCTHLAETPEERLFIAEACGTQRTFLEDLGIWEDSLLECYGRGLHPVEHLRETLEAVPLLLAHVNDAPDEAIGTLARTGASVAYCPRASAYFGAERHFGPHRYRDMLAAGVNVALGSDSLVNLPEAAADPERGGISILDEMRLLHRRDGTDPRLLLEMATTNGAAALGLDPTGFRLSTGSEPWGLVAVPVGPAHSGRPLGRALGSAGAPELLSGANLCG